MDRMLKMQERVALIMNTYPETRDDDKLLYYYVCKQIASEWKIDIDNLSVKDFLTNPAYKFPGSKSVERARRKLQENPMYWGKRKKERMQIAGEFKAYSKTSAGFDIPDDFDFPEEPEEEVYEDNPFLED